MKPRIVLLAFAALACRQPPAPPGTMGEMTPEDHAKMSMGAGASTGERQPLILSAQQATALGVRFAAVTKGPLEREIRSVGVIAPAETGLAEVAPKVDGFVEELFVNATGVPVRRGQPLLSLYSPMLVAAQQELLTALRLAAGDSTDALLVAARRRLAWWDISPDQIARLEQSGSVTRTLTLRAPFDGVVLEKLVVKGQSVMPGMKLFRLADLASVWVEGQVFEQDLGAVGIGTPVRLEVAAYPGREFAGRVSFVYPTVDDSSRSGRVRIVLPNRDGTLKPGMYATLLFRARLQDGRPLLSIPSEAAVRTGARDLVFVSEAGGRIAPREVLLGEAANGRIEVKRGLTEHERVVAAANFLVDAESRLAPERRP